MSVEKIQASVLIIGQNAQKHLKRCLDSLVNFAEVVFVDGGSVDKTIEIAKSYPNVKVFENKWPGFIQQRNLSIKKASYPWCFMIDCDEAITKELENEIRKVVLKNDLRIVMYRIVRTEFFEGMPIEVGHGKSEYQERLFQRDRIQYTGGTHHEHLIDGHHISTKPELVADFPYELRILHDENYNLDEMMTKLARFAMYIGAEKYNKGRRVNAFEILFSFVWTSIRMMWRSRASGQRGIVLSLMKAYSDSLSKLYIYNLQHFSKTETTNADKKYLG
jgi:glycosyltransferase involved in cell wall biosynthesis